MSTTTTQAPVATLALRDGRTLAYAEYGDPAGAPVIVFHGTPGSRLDRHPDPTILAGLGVRLIMPDRPGYGHSSFQRHRRLLDWPADVAQLADARGLARFAVAGVSGGGPHAAACAYALPERITRAALVASVAPPRAPGFWAGMNKRDTLELRATRLLPTWFLRFDFNTQVRPLLRDPQAYLANLAVHFPAADRAVAADPALQAIFAESIAEAYRQGPAAHIQDDKLFTRAWGFRVEDIAVPVDVWQGADDDIIPPSHGRYLAAAIPGAAAHLVPGQAHLSLPVACYRDILAALLA
jgi:pimeloyl-ACP methyl ester carboxylesterase